VGILTPRIGEAIQGAGMYAVTFSRRGWDGGNRRIQRLSERVLCRLSAGDLIVLHDTKPKTAFRKDRWLNEVEKIIVGIQRRNLSIVSLKTLIGRPIMERVSGDDMEMP
jgi:hypothetical protein